MMTHILMPATSSSTLIAAVPSLPSPVVLAYIAAAILFILAAAGGGVDPLWIADHPMHNTGITVVDGDPGAGWSLTSWDDGAWDQAS